MDSVTGAAERISRVLRELRGQVGRTGEGEVLLDGMTARVVASGDGYFWTVSALGETVASGVSGGLEGACASAAIRLVDAVDARTG